MGSNEAAPRMVGGIDMSAVATVDAWIERCAMTGREGDKIANSLGNAITILAWHVDWQGVLSFDVRTQKVLMVKPPPFPGDIAEPNAQIPRPVTDEDAGRCEAWAQRDPMIATTIRSQHWLEAMATVARKNPRDLFKDWLGGLEWDGVARADTWLTDYAGCKDDAYVRAVGASFLIGIVARTHVPGCKLDTVLTLQGRQGAGKSTLLRHLVGDDWFTDANLDISSKDAAINIQGPALLELGELDALSRQQVEKIKAFITRQTDTFRPPYGRQARDFPRRCVFAATTNDDSFLRDVTGNRRFWPVSVGDRIDVEGVAVARDQLFAEAMHRFGAGERWYIVDPEIEAMAEQEQRDRMQVDSWEEILSKCLDGTGFVTMAQILKEIGVEPANHDQVRQNKAARCMRSLGWVKTRRRINGRLTYGYVPGNQVVSPFHD